MHANQNPAARLLDRKSVALAVIDVQEKLVPALFEPTRLVRNCQLLVRMGLVLGLPTILTTHYRKGLGSLIPEIASAAPGLEPLDKTSFDCFGDAVFPSHLKRVAPEARTLLVAGAECHVCVTQTVLGASRPDTWSMWRSTPHRHGRRRIGESGCSAWSVRAQLSAQRK